VLTWNQIAAAIAEAVGTKEPRIECIPVDSILNRKMKTGEHQGRDADYSTSLP
jgi:hypothetical protein